MIQIFTREVPLGKIQQGKRSFKITLTIQYDESWNDPLSLWVTYNGFRYDLYQKLDCLLNGSITGGESNAGNSLCKRLYRLWVHYKSSRASRYSVGQLDMIIDEELRTGRRFVTNYEAETFLLRIGVNANPTYPPVPVIREEDVEWLFSLPGTGHTYGDVSRSSVSIPDEDFFAIISTAG